MSDQLSTCVVPAISALGGVARRLHEWLSGNTPFKNWQTALAEMIARVIIAVFCGFVCVWLAEFFEVSENTRYLSAAIGGWSGGEIMGWVTSNYKRRIDRILMEKQKTEELER